MADTAVDRVLVDMAEFAVDSVSVDTEDIGGVSGIFCVEF